MDLELNTARLNILLLLGPETCYKATLLLLNVRMHIIVFWHLRMTTWEATGAAATAEAAAVSTMITCLDPAFHPAISQASGPRLLSQRE